MSHLVRRLASSIRSEPREFVPRVAWYLRAYPAAIAAGRRLRKAPAGTPAAAFEYASRFSWAGRPIAPVQNRDEIVALLELLAADPPRVVLEIGCWYGGTLFLWTRVATEDALLIAIDDGERVLADRSPTAIVCRSFARARQRVETLFCRDSHDPSTLAAVERLLAGRRVDFLFVDGDHTYAGVRQDFEMYAPLVRPGGLIAFHDIFELEEGLKEVPRFWQELKARAEVTELNSGVGIGLYRTPAAAAS